MARSGRERLIGLHGYRSSQGWALSLASSGLMAFSSLHICSAFGAPGGGGERWGPCSRSPTRVGGAWAATRGGNYAPQHATGKIRLSLTSEPPLLRTGPGLPRPRPLLRAGDLAESHERLPSSRLIGPAYLPFGSEEEKLLSDWWVPFGAN